MLKVLQNNKRQKLTENDEEDSSKPAEKPMDLFQRILDNIDKYNYLCDYAFAGPITKKELLSHISGIQSLPKGDSDSGSNKASQCQIDCDSHNKSKMKLKKIPKAPLTVPIAPKFQTETRLATKDKQSLKTSEEIELEEINKKKALLESQIKINQDSVKHLDNYEKPVFAKKEATTFKEFSFHTTERSSKHSEFRKKNIEKLEEQKEAEKVIKEDKKHEEKNKQEKILKIYNAWNPNSNKTENNTEKPKQFVSLKSTLEGMLMRHEDEEIRLEQSPRTKLLKRQLTTPKSPELSVKKRCEFSEKVKELKTTEEMELEQISLSAFKARPMPKCLFSAQKDPLKRSPTEKKTEFHEFNITQIKKKNILTTEEIELQTHCKDFKATELDKRIFDQTLESILGKEKDHIVTVPVEFKFKTDNRKRDKKAIEKSDDSSQNNRSKSRVRKYKEFIIKKNENFKPTCPKAPNLNTQNRIKVKKEEPEIPKFKALPMPDYSKLASEAFANVSNSKLHLTKPVEFNFATDFRLKRSKMIAESQSEEMSKENRDFKASKVPNFTKFAQIKPSNRQPTKCHAPILASELRMQMRKEREQRRIEDLEAKELSLQDITEVEVTVRSSPQVRLYEDSIYRCAEMIDADQLSKFDAT